MVNINWAVPDAWDSVEEDDGLVTYVYQKWITTKRTKNRHESYRECYAISNGIQVWIGRIEHVCVRIRKRK